MLIDNNRVRLNRHLLQCGHGVTGYIRVKLYQQDGSTAFVSAHKLVLWAIHGMPTDVSHNVVMHYPCNNSWCLSRRHLHWATQSMNMLDTRPRTALDNDDADNVDVENDGNNNEVD